MVVIPISIICFGITNMPIQKSEAFCIRQRRTTCTIGPGANPVEYVLAALNGCLTTSLIYHAAAQAVKIDEVQSTLSGDLDLQGFLGMSENVRNGYEKIKVNFKVKSDAPREKIRELINLARRSDILSNPTTLEVSLQA
jgi:uncharacterized OsmC-like protein